jgi:hypothetical protein
MAFDPCRLTPQQIFKAAQQPALWLISAQKLRDAAEVIIKREDDYLVPYLRAHDEAVNAAMGIACAEGEKAGHAEIAARTPNYPPAQLLYSYAIENVLKGLIVANDSGLIKSDKLDAALKDHDLLTLAERADFTVLSQEQQVLAALSLISVWVGRYPVALNVRNFTGTPNRNELMDYGSRHTIMRVFFDRVVKALEAKLPKPLESLFDAVVVFRPPGT